jgi:hypothetical protein
LQQRFDRRCFFGVIPVLVEACWSTAIEKKRFSTIPAAMRENNKTKIGTYIESTRTRARHPRNVLSTKPLPYCSTTVVDLTRRSLRRLPGRASAREGGKAVTGRPCGALRLGCLEGGPLDRYAMDLFYPLSVLFNVLEFGKGECSCNFRPARESISPPNLLKGRTLYSMADSRPFCHIIAMRIFSGTMP